MSGAKTGFFQRQVVERLLEVRGAWRIILRLAVAPPLAWWLSMQLFAHNQAFYAPIAAVLTLTVAANRRVLVVVEIIVGAAFGILIGEALILTIGRGAWQLAFIIALSVAAARFVRLPGLAVTQAVISGVLLVVIVPAAGMDDPAVTRFVDAIIGGFVGLAMIVLIPANPVRVMDKEIKDLRNELGDILDHTADALELGDANIAAEALFQARATQPMIDRVSGLSDSVTEMARISPLRWKQRTSLAKRSEALTELDHAVRNTRVLTRRAAAMLRNGEAAPAGLIEALRQLAHLSRYDVANVDKLVDVSRSAVEAASVNLTINTASIASQIRAIVADMLLATGTPFGDLDEMLDVD